MADTTYVSDYDGTMVKTTDGRFVTVYKGGAVPSNADPEHVKVLLDREMVHKGQPTSGVDHDPDATPPFTAPSGGQQTGPNLDDDGNPKEPSKSGSKGDWVAFATFKADGDPGKLAAIEGMTRDQLAEAYATPADA